MHRFFLTFWALGIHTSCVHPVHLASRPLNAQASTDLDSLRRILSERELTQTCPPEEVCLTIIQLNDVYEIDGGQDGLTGGLDRVATWRQLLAENPASGPVLLTLSGDFLNPSGFTALRDEGRPLTGKPMISLLKALGTDFVTFGNHEFDLPYQDFQARLDESTSPLEDVRLLKRCGLARESFKTEELTPSCSKQIFQGGQEKSSCMQWISTNVFTSDASSPHSGGSLRAGGSLIPKARLFTIQNGPQKIHLALLGLTIEKNRKDYIRYGDLQTEAKSTIASLVKGEFGQKPDLIIGLTHTDQAEDYKLLAQNPEIHMILGGHDHVETYQCLDDQRRCLAKSAPNAKSIYVHRFRARPAAEPSQTRWQISSHLLSVDARVPREPDVSALIDCWFQEADRLWRAQDTSKPKIRAPLLNYQGPSLRGSEDLVRRRQGTNLTQLLALSMLKYANQDVLPREHYDLAILNAGAIRLDDDLHPGPISSYETIRTLPFGGRLLGAKIKIRDLAKILHLTWGIYPDGNGGILHTYPRLNVVDRERADISEESITHELMEITQSASKEDILRIVATDYFLQAKDNLPRDLKSFFEIETQTSSKGELRDIFIKALEQAGQN